MIIDNWIFKTDEMVADNIQPGKIIQKNLCDWLNKYKFDSELLLFIFNENVAIT